MGRLYRCMLYKCMELLDYNILNRREVWVSQYNNYSTKNLVKDERWLTCQKAASHH